MIKDVVTRKCACIGGYNNPKCLVVEKNNKENRKRNNSTHFLSSFPNIWRAFPLFYFTRNGLSRFNSCWLRGRVCLFWHLIFKLFIILVWIKKVHQSFHVNGSVFFAPGKYEAFSSIDIFFAELYTDNSSGPGRDN